MFRLLEDMPFLDTITAAITTTTATTVSVTNGANFAANSRIEIDNEVMLVSSISGNDLTVQRGYESSFPATHASAALVRRDPRFLRANVQEAINVVLNDWLGFYVPRLTWDLTTAGSYVPTRAIYPVPADAKVVLRVTWKFPLGYIQYEDVSFDPISLYDTTICSTGKGIQLRDHLPIPGQPLHVFYERNWGYLTADTDTVPSDFPEEGDDLLPTGAALYLIGWRAVPKFRTDEVIFHREAGAPMPTNLNLSEQERMYQRWLARAQRVRARRLVGAGPQKVWVGWRA